MRLLHTSDWHLGRTVKQRSRDADFDAVLAEITGDSPGCRARTSSSTPGTCSTPTGRAPRTLPGACARCSDLSEVAPVVVVAGNHDSPVLLEALDFAVTAFGRQDRVRRRAPAEVRRPARGTPATAGSWTTRRAAGSSGSGWPRCRSSTRTGSWTSSPARPAAPATTPASCARSRPSCSAGCSTAASPDRGRPGLRRPPVRARAPCPPGPSGPSTSATPT